MPWVSNVLTWIEGLLLADTSSDERISLGVGVDGAEVITGTPTSVIVTRSCMLIVRGKRRHKCREWLLSGCGGRDSLHHRYSGVVARALSGGPSPHIGAPHGTSPASSFAASACGRDREAAHLCGCEHCLAPDNGVQPGGVS